MRHFALTLALALGAGQLSAQTMDLVVFSDDGQAFTLVVDGQRYNEEPATRVVATGIRNETPMLMVQFQDASLEPIKQGGYFDLGREYTLMVTTNKKGKRVLRPSGEAALGTAAAKEPAKPDPAGFVADAPATRTKPASTATQTTTVGGVQQTTSVTVVEEGGDTGEGVDMSMDINGVGIQMGVKVTDPTMTSRTTTTTTTTTTTMADMDPVEPVREEPAAYSMPGYSGPIGCPWPMNDGEFNDLKNSVAGKSFEDTKLSLAKQVARDRCFTAAQVRDLIGVFSFEDSKLDLAKYAYDHTYDIGNYYKVSDAFTFESSMEELNEYIEAR